MKKTLLLALFALLTTGVFAGGGRVEFSPEGRGVAEIDGIEVKARLYEVGQGPTDGQLSIGEKAEFRIENPREGDRCDNRGQPSDSSGYIYGTCYAKTEGSYYVYIHSYDKESPSGKYIIYFDPKPTSTPTPTITPTPTPKKVIEKEAIEEEIGLNEENEEEEPTPTPEEDTEVAGFFSQPGNLIAVLVFLLSLGGLGFLLVKHKLIDLSKYLKKKGIPNLLNKVKADSKHPENPPTKNE